jgi:CheY-like chemotaxis protein
MSILVVDDDSGIRELLVLFLTHHGYAASAACNGLEAIDYLRQSSTRPCLIVLDLMMPIMSGVEFRREQQQDPQLAVIPVAVLSAAENLEEHAPELDVDTYLQKPIDFPSLLAMVERHCHKIPDLTA